MHCQIYINLSDFSSAMILITKTLATLDEANDGNLGQLRLQADLKVCEIKSNLPTHVHESFKMINSKISYINHKNLSRSNTTCDGEWD